MKFVKENMFFFQFGNLKQTCENNYCWLMEKKFVWVQENPYSSIFFAVIDIGNKNRVVKNEKNWKRGKHHVSLMMFSYNNSVTIITIANINIIHNIVFSFFYLRLGLFPISCNIFFDIMVFSISKMFST